MPIVYDDPQTAPKPQAQPKALGRIVYDSPPRGKIVYDEPSDPMDFSRFTQPPEPIAEQPQVATRPTPFAPLREDTPTTSSGSLQPLEPPQETVTGYTLVGNRKTSLSVPTELPKFGPDIEAFLETVKNASFVQRGDIAERIRALPKKEQEQIGDVLRLRFGEDLGMKIPFTDQVFAQDIDLTPGVLESFGRAAGGQVGPTAGGVAGAVAGMRAPGGLAVKIPATIGLTVLGAMGGKKAQDVAEAVALGKEKAEELATQRNVDLAAQPWASFAGEVAPSFAFIRPSPSGLKSAKDLASRIIGADGKDAVIQAWRAATPESRAYLVNSAFGSGLDATLQTLRESMREDGIDLAGVGRILAAAGIGATQVDPTRLGRAFGIQPTITPTTRKLSTIAPETPTIRDATPTRFDEDPQATAVLRQATPETTQPRIQGAPDPQEPIAQASEIPPQQIVSPEVTPEGQVPAGVARQAAEEVTVNPEIATRPIFNNVYENNIPVVIRRADGSLEEATFAGYWDGYPGEPPNIGHKLADGEWSHGPLRPGDTIIESAAPLPPRANATPEPPSAATPEPAPPQTAAAPRAAETAAPATPEPVAPTAETAPTPTAARPAPTKPPSYKEWSDAIDAGADPADLPNPKLVGNESRLYQKKLRDLGSAGRITITPGTATAGGALLGGTTGAGIGITQGDTPEERLSNAVKYGLAGIAVGAGAGRGAFGAGRSLSRPNRVARRLGIIEEFPTISNDVSNAKLRLDRFTAGLLRGSPLRKHFFDAAKRTDSAINASMDEAKITLADMRSKINANTFSVNQRAAVEAKLNEVFADISKIDELPVYLRPQAHRIYELRLRNATRLGALDGLTDATRETILENGGNYLARSYAIFNLRDGLEARAYRAAIPQADREAAMDAIQELWAPPTRTPEEVKLAADTIELAAKNQESAVAVIKSLRPWMTDDDAARIAAWVAAGKQTADTPNNRALRGLYQELIKPTEVTRKEAAVLLDDFLDRDNFMGFSVGRKKLGGKDVTSLYRKQEIDPRLRRVLGEIKDPLENAYHSIKNQVGLIERDVQQREFIRIGEQMGIMTRDADIAAQKGMRPMLESGTQLNSPYDNWDGVFIYPWLREEFVGTVGKAGEAPRVLDLAVKTLKTATGLFKWLKLIPAPDSRSVNLIGAYWNNLTNGRALNPVGKGTRDGLKAVFLANGILSPKGDLNTKELLRLREVLIRNNILDESVLGQDFIQNARRGLAGEFFDKLDKTAQKEINIPLLRKTYMAGRFVASGNEFAAGDDIMRTAGFLAEKSRYKKAFPTLTDAQLEDAAGRVMNQTGMTYSEVPFALRELSQLGIADPFISFPYSLFRSTANTARLGTVEVMDGIATGNPALARIGATRLAALGAGAALASGYGISKLVNEKNGVTDEQEELGKQFFVPEYAKDSPLAFDAKIKNGKGTFVQMNYLLPTSLVTSAIEEGIKVGMEDGVASGAAAAAERTASNFTGLIGEDRPRVAPVPRTVGIMLGLINEDSFGRPIYNPQDPDKWEKIGKQLGYDWAPGFWTKAVRLYKANNPDETKPTGRVYSNKEEWLRFLGRRATTVDARQMLPSKAYQLNQDYQSAVRLYQEAVARGGEADPAYAQSQEVAKAKFDEMVGLRDAARAWDIDDNSIMLGFIRGGMSKKMVAQIMREVYIPKPQGLIDQQIQKKQMQREQYKAMGGSEIPEETLTAAQSLIQRVRARNLPQDQFMAALRAEFERGNVGKQADGRITPEFSQALKEAMENP